MSETQKEKEKTMADNQTIRPSDANNCKPRDRKLALHIDTDLCLRAPPQDEPRGPPYPMSPGGQREERPRRKTVVRFQDPPYPVSDGKYKI